MCMGLCVVEALQMCVQVSVVCLSDALFVAERVHLSVHRLRSWSGCVSTGLCVPNVHGAVAFEG